MVRGSDKFKPGVRESTEAFGSTERKHLGNISNMQQSRPSMLDDKSQFIIPASTKEYIDKLKMENVTLVKLLADKNKIIELSGIELRKLRVSMRKLQQQNLQLAQSNSQMLAELTIDKDRLRLLQHELGCKTGLLVAKGLELKEKEETIAAQIVDEEAVGLVKLHTEKLGSSEAFRDNTEPSNIYTRKQSKSLGPSTVKQSKDKKADNKRRQSARLKSEEPKPADDVFEVESNTLSMGPLHNDRMKELSLGPLHNDRMKEDFSNSMTLTTEKENKISDSKRISVRRQSARFISEEPKPGEDLLAVDPTGLVSGPIRDDQMHEDVSFSICLSVEKDNKVSDSKRLPVRRQSARYKSEEPEPYKALFEINTNYYVQNEVSSSTCLSVEKDIIEDEYGPCSESRDFGRPSLGRPSRQAVRKVNSYKEVPLNVKMRRTE